MDEEIRLYKKFMEGLLEKRPDMRAERIKTKNKTVWPENTEMHQKYISFFGDLSDENKTVLADLLQDTRDAAIFDTLEYFDDKINLDGLHVTQNGAEFPKDFFGGDFHNDWVALFQGDLWGESR